MCQILTINITRINKLAIHYDDVIMTTMASQITSLTIVYSTVYSGADQRKHQSSASLAFVWGIHRGPVNSPHKWPVTRKMFPFDDVIMYRKSSGSQKPRSQTLMSTFEAYFTLGNPFAYPGINTTRSFCYLRGKCSFRLI